MINAVLIATPLDIELKKNSMTIEIGSCEDGKLTAQIFTTKDGFLYDLKITEYYANQ